MGTALIYHTYQVSYAMSVVLELHVFNPEESECACWRAPLLAREM
jgi:hypothetical protein